MERKKLINLYEIQRDAFWVPSEIHMNSDRKDWSSMPEEYRQFLTFILAFFAQADGIVIENLTEKFQRETNHYKEASAFYAMQNAIEVIHNEMYSIMIETFIQDINEREKALNAIQNYPSIKVIADWIIRWMNSDRPLLERIIAFACVEGIIFSGAFCAIYWIKDKKLLHGLCKANEFIAKDEAIHTRFAIELYHQYCKDGYEKLSRDDVHDIISSAMGVAESFIESALRVELIGMSSKSMIEYVRCTADYLSTELGYGSIYRAVNPFPYMIMIAIENKTNFFEDTVSEYSKVKNFDSTFTTDADF